MKKHDNGIQTKLASLQASVALFGVLLSVDEKAVPRAMRDQALLRRLRICFLILYDYLSEQTALPADIKQKPFEDSVDYFVTKKGLTEDDKKAILILGNIYASISLAQPGHGPDAEKIILEVPQVYEFLGRIALANS